MPRKKQEPKFIKKFSEEECLPPKEFWEGYNALIKVLVHHYKEYQDIGNENTYN
ncbi:MAG: hypothetical protein WCG23_02900 [bacterium]